MNLNTELMDIAYEYVSKSQMKATSFPTGDVVAMLNHTRDVTVVYANFVQACDNDHILVYYYRSLVESLNTEDYDKASEYKNLIITHESKI